jgi:hypothetical protein
MLLSRQTYLLNCRFKQNMKTIDFKTKSPQRTRSHYIESISQNYVEGLIVHQGHISEKPTIDYGYDLVMMTFDYKSDQNYSSGEIENGAVFIQIKATDNLKTLARNPDTISFEISLRHARFWHSEPMPVYFIIYSVADKEAYWIHVQSYFKSPCFTWPKNTHQETVTIHLSRMNILNATAIEIFRKEKRRVLASIAQG